MEALLHVKNSATGRSFDFELSRKETRMGRSPESNDLVLHSERASRRHAVIREADGKYVLADLNSANGTTVNGARITEHTLADKDVIEISDYVLTFELKMTPVIQYQNERLGFTVMFRSPEQVALDVPKTDKGPSASETDRKALMNELEALRKKAETLGHLYELNRVLSSVFSLEDIFKKVGEMIFRLTPADRFFVLLKDQGSPELKPYTTRYRDKIGAASTGEVSISKTVLDRVLSERVTLLSTDAQEDERLALARSLIIQQVHSVMCAPLLIKDDVGGVIYVDSHDALKTFSSDDLDLLNALAVAASMSIDNANTHEQLLREALARAAYGRFMPRHLVSEILADPKKVSLGGTNQFVTALFSDIRGFTSMSEGLPPETVVQMLNKYFGDMTPLVFEHKGTLDKYIGDGLMALFGVPYAEDDSANAAVEAAIAMQRGMTKLNRELAAEGFPEIAIGIGINTGNVTVGYIGSTERTDYTAIGDAVNLAARLEKQAGPWQILISRSTFESLKSPIRTKLFGEVKVKGKKEVVQVYEVMWREGDTGIHPAIPERSKS